MLLTYILFDLRVNRYPIPRYDGEKKCIVIIEQGTGIIISEFLFIACVDFLQII